ncbi:MAG: MEDS domain-containing protein, partial [Micromonosporaceae bacterium]
MCLFSGDERERRQVMSTFIKQGLDGNDRVLCFFADPARANSVLDFLEPDTRHVLVSSGQLGLASTADNARDHGRFHPEQASEELRREVDATMAAGWRGLRVSGDTWASPTSSTQQLIDSELAVTDALSELPVSVICEYDMVAYGPDRADQFLRAHPGRVGVDPWRSHGAMRVFRLFEPPEIRVEGNVDAVSG